MNWDDRIEVKPGVMMGKPVIKGTRITVEIVLERLQDGESVDEIANSYKNIEVDDVQAAIEFAIESIKKEKVFVTPGASERITREIHS